MGRHRKENPEDYAFKPQSYFRLLKYVRPYWPRLCIGIVASIGVSSSLFITLMMLPQMVGFVEIREVPKAAVEVAAPAAEPVALNGGAAAEAAKPAPRTSDEELNRMLDKADSYMTKLHLPLRIDGREVIVEWPWHFQFEAVDADGRMAWQLFSLYAILFVAAWLLKNVAEYINRYFTRWVGNKVVADMRNEIFRKLANQSLRFYSTTDVGQLISRSTNDTSAIEHSVSETIADMTICPLQILTCLGAIAIACRQQENYSLLIILLTGMPLILIPIFVLGRKIRKIYKRTYARIAEVTTRMHEVFSGIRLVKAYHTEEAETVRFRGVNRKYFRNVVTASKLQLLMSPMMEFVAVSSVLFFLVYAYSQNVRFAQLTALLSPAIMAYKPIKDLSKVITYIQRSMAAADRYFNIIDTHTELPEKPDAVKLTDFKEKIEFDRVSFGYGDRRIFEDLSFDIPRGSMVAVVGETGSGKSTIANLLARFYDVDSGAVKIDGIDVRDCEIASLRKQIGMVTQDAILFNETIASNIAYGLPEATHEEIVAAAKQANAHEFIVDGRHRDGYETVVGDKGFKLSGGEKQRISIARAILHNPPILILDEATSALDTVTERLVQEALTKLMANRTVFAIAHRLSTIRYADMILVLDKGNIVERGTHDELMARAGIYKKLYDTQFTIDA